MGVGKGRYLADVLVDGYFFFLGFPVQTYLYFKNNLIQSTSSRICRLHVKLKGGDTDSKHEDKLATQKPDDKQKGAVPDVAHQLHTC